MDALIAFGAVTAFISLFFIGFANDNGSFTGLFLRILVVLGVAVMVSGIVHNAQESAKLPDLAGLCKGELTLSWKVEKSERQKFTDAIRKDAKCDLKITTVKPPPAFPDS